MKTKVEQVLDTATALATKMKKELAQMKDKVGLCDKVSAAIKTSYGIMRQSVSACEKMVNDCEMTVKTLEKTVREVTGDGMVIYGEKELQESQYP